MRISGLEFRRVLFRSTGRRLHRFSWINEWKELADANGTPLGIELILPDWFYAGVLDAALVLTIDPAYFRLTGGIERWLYRLVRKHGGRQEHGRSEEHTSELQSLMRISYAVFCLKKKKEKQKTKIHKQIAKIHKS